MFAFVIWDRQERRAFGARDHFGIKPLHYLETADGVYLASEKKALLPFAPAATAGDAGRRHGQPVALPDPAVRAGAGHPAPAASTGSARASASPGRPGGGIAPAPLLPAGLPADAGRRPADAVRPDPGDAARERAPAHARRRAGRRVPVQRHRLDRGGGAGPRVQPEHPHLHRRLRRGRATPRSRSPRSRPGTSDVTTIPTKIGPQDMMDALPKIVWHLDDPVADPALVPLYFVAKKAAEHVTVVLSGEGADEFFGGYTIYREPLSLAGVQRPARPDAEAACGRSSKVDPARASRARASWSAAPPRSRSATTATRGCSPRRRSSSCCAATTRRCATPTSPPRSTPRRADLDDVTKMQYVDLYTWLRGDILVKADRMSMAHSLELRVPFLDKEVFEVAADRPGRAEAAAALGRHQVRAAPGAARASCRRPSSTGASSASRRPTRVWLRGEMYDWAQRHPGHLGRRATCSTCSTPAGCWTSTGAGGRPLPQGVDGAGVLRLARHLRGAHARPGHRRATSRRCSPSRWSARWCCRGMAAHSG